MNLRMEIVSVTKTECPPEWYWFSDFNKWVGIHIWYCYSGGAIVRVSGEKFIINPGDSFVFYLDENHECSHDSLNPLKVFTIHLHLYDESDNFFLPDKKDLPRLIRLGNTSLNVSLWENLLLQHQKGNEKGQLVWFGPIFSQLLDATSNNNVHPDVEKVCLEILANPQKNFTLKELCHISGYSPNHLIQLFKNYKKVTPYQFCINTKIEKAKGLILYSNLTLSEIAHHLGYYDLNHFSKQFKKNVGLSPTDFCKAVHKD